MRRFTSPVLARMNGRVRVLSVVVLAVLLGAGAFAITRQVFEGSSAVGQAPPGEQPEPPAPSDEETPIPGATPDISKPFWYVPYLNQDATLARFEGQIAGIQIGDYEGSKAEDEGYCEGGTEASGPAAEARFATSLVALSAGARALGTLFSGPSYVVCPEGVPRRMEAVFTVKAPAGAPGGLGAGAVTIFRFVGAPQSPISDPAERWSAGVVKGHPAAILRPVVESVGSSAIIVHDPTTRVTTAVLGQGVYLKSLEPLMEVLLP